MTPESLQALRDFHSEAEGRIDHMYLDTVGLVTCGIGHMIPNVEAALTLPFQPSGLIALDFRGVQAAPKGMLAARYAPLCSTRLSQPDIDAIYEADRHVVTTELGAKLPVYRTLPDPAQMAVTDMAFNLGITGFLKYAKLIAALSTRNWDQCAQECHRNGIKEWRNEWTVEQFGKAA